MEVQVLSPARLHLLRNFLHMAVLGRPEQNGHRRCVCPTALENWTEYPQEIDALVERAQQEERRAEEQWRRER